MTAPLLERVRRRLIDDADGRDAVGMSDMAAALRDEGVVLGDEALLDLMAVLRDELQGAGPLQPLLRDPEVTDVLVNGPREVWVDRGRGLERAAVSMTDDHAVLRLAQRLAAAAGRRLDEAAPFVDARMLDGTRLHAVIPPVATRGTVISLRIPRRHSFTLGDLIDRSTVCPRGGAWIQAIVRARLAFLVTGATGSGKTTILNSLLGLVPPDERVVIVEDSGELRPDHPHVVSLEARPANLEGAGVVTLRDLVRQALRMRPDRVVVGEVRGAEVVDLLAALNTGHEGGCGTVHANSPADLPARLEALGLMAGLPRDAVHALAAAGLHACVHVARTSAGRRLTGIHVVTEVDGRVRVTPALVREGDTLVPRAGAADLARLIERGGVEPPEAVR